jgi:hypothetical protein
VRVHAERARENQSRQAAEREYGEGVVKSVEERGETLQQGTYKMKSIV